MKTPYPIALAWLFLTALVLVGPAYSGGWILDDAFLIGTNEYLREPGAWSRWFVTDMWDVTAPEVQGKHRLSYYRPLPMISYHLDWVLGQGDPLAFHLTNAVLQGGVALLVVRVCRRWASRPAAVAAGFLFVVHPAKVENVAWISGRTDLLCALGMMLALDGLLACRENRSSGWIRQVIGVIVAYLSKEHAVILPALILFVGWAAGKQKLSWDSLKKESFVLRTVAVHLGLAILYLTLRQVLMPLRSSHTKGLGAVEHGLLVLESLGRAVECWFFPARLAITSSSLEKTAGGIVFHEPLLALGAFTLLVVPVAVFWFRDRRPVLSASLVLFLVTLSPTLNLVWTGGYHIYTPRFLYIPSLALSFAAAALVTKKRRWRVALTPLLVLLAGMTWWRAGHFSSSEKFYAFEFESNPRDPMNVRWQIAIDRRAQNQTLALHRIQCAHRFARSHYPLRRVEESLLLEALDLVVHHTPDHQTRFLTELSKFVDDRVSGREARLGPPLKLFLPKAPVSGQSKSSKAHLLLLRANLEARLGRARSALLAVQRARSACADCPLVLQRGPDLALRAQDPHVAEQWWSELGLLKNQGSPAAVRLAEVRRLKAAIASSSPVERERLLAQQESAVGNYSEALQHLQRAMTLEKQELPEAAFQALGQLAAQAGNQQVAHDALVKAGISPVQATEQIQKWQEPLRFLTFPLPAVEFEEEGCRLAHPPT